jgi:inner membrane protein
MLTAMSSFAGHALAAATTYALGPRPGGTRGRTLWLAWLVVLAWAPDVDYLVRSLDRGPDHRLRITHSLAFGLLLPALTAGTLRAAGVRSGLLVRLVVQAVGASLSHVVLDLLVGVTALPLFWPVSSARVRLPFGLLPSAGRLDLANPLLYRNMLIELGALLPLAAVIVVAFGAGRSARLPAELGPGRPTRSRAAIVAGLLAVAVAFMAWAATLSR